VKRSAMVVAALMTASGAGAHDKWEIGLFHDDDAREVTRVFLSHGVRQTHDLHIEVPPADRDWMAYVATVGHSYEVRVTSSLLPFRGDNASLDDARLWRTNAAGTVMAGATGPAGDIVLRWTESPSTAGGYVLVVGPDGEMPSARDQYDIELTDTTAFVPRFNNGGTQTTVLVLQNTTGRPLAGTIAFHSAGGGLLHTEPLVVVAHGTQVFNSASAPALAGQSGSVVIAHDGPYGAVAGKAVALEPATGFVFDTQLTVVPR
jgi:hypothetical protein